jgi:hypothetical protein
MFNKVLSYCASLSLWKVLGHGLILAIVLEAITVVLRFGFKLESTRDTTMIGTMTFGLRVHHGYIGLFLAPLAWCFPLGLRHALWIIAIGLIFSDLAHHFIVLWYFTGSPQFDIFYR